MAAFVTGAAGFVGLAVTEALLMRGERVVGFDLCSVSEQAQRTFAGLPGRFEQVSGDICDADGLKAARRQSDANCLVNLAAPAILPRSHLRDWLYARDAAAAVLELLYARTRRHLVYNLAAGFMWSIADFCARLQQVCSGFEWRFDQNGESANIDYYAPSDRSAMAIERLRSDTAFLPRYNLAEALADYLQWLGPAFDSVPSHGGRHHDWP
jgi:nucleoside-diphosphate-sugar epimerase